ncbi:MAG: PorP/SprF family type IX secretion system membrane protein [Bacteroidota bacterium]
MKKMCIVALLVILQTQIVCGQTNILLSQSFENLSIYSPSFTGANDFLDIKTGFRRQWVGLNGSPSNIFLHVQSPVQVTANDFVRNRKRAERKGGGGKSKDKQVSKLKLGLGGFLVQTSRGPVNQLETAINMAVHVPVSFRTYLSLGLANGINSTTLNLNDLILQNPSADQAINALALNGSNVSNYHLNASIGIHSDKYYFSYNVWRLTRAKLSGNGALDESNSFARHHIVGGYRFKPVNKFEFTGGSQIGFDQGSPTFYELSFRARYYKQYWAGLAYRNDLSLIILLGWQINSTVKFSYSFDYKSSEAENLANASHEVLLGFVLFNKKNSTSFW